MRLIVFIVCLLVSQSSGFSQGLVRIVNGTVAKAEQFPYVVALNVYFNNSNDFFSLCGGTIISRRWILTAAHCFKYENSQVSEVIVIAGSIYTEDKDESKAKPMSVKPKDVIVHKHYDFRTIAFDIGLIKLPRELKLSSNIQIARLPKRGDKKNTYMGRWAISAGWGKNSKGLASPVLKYVKLQIISNKQCEEEWKSHQDNKLILSSFLCVSTKQGLPCVGDSGGPLILDDKSRTVVGIVSHGLDEECKIQVPDVLTRVSSFVDWIEKHTGVLGK